MTFKFCIDAFLAAGQSFLLRMLCELDEKGIDVTSSQIDHLCFRVNTDEEYAVFKNELSKNGVLLTETQVNGRLISTFFLPKPFQVKTQRVNLVELPAPKADCPYPTGFEHAEVVITESLDMFSSRFPRLQFIRSGNRNLNSELCLKLDSGQIKFHYQPLNRIIEIEQAMITDIIFDLDGTLVQSRDTIFEINRRVFSEILQKQITLEEAITKFHPEFGKMFEAFDVTNEVLKSRAIALWSSVSDEFVFHPFEDIKTLIETLSQTTARLHLWTARDEASARKILRQHNIESRFKTISGSTDEYSKPDPRALNFDWKNAPKNSYVLLGDSATDIVASKNINAIAAGALWCKHSNEHSLSKAGAEAHFYTVKEFSHWILRKIAS